MTVLYSLPKEYVQQAKIWLLFQVKGITAQVLAQCKSSGISIIVLHNNGDVLAPAALEHLGGLVGHESTSPCARQSGTVEDVT